MPPENSSNLISFKKINKLWFRIESSYSYLSTVIYSCDANGKVDNLFPYCTHYYHTLAEMERRHAETVENLEDLLFVHKKGNEYEKSCFVLR